MDATGRPASVALGIRNLVHVTLTRANTGDQPISTATIVGEEMHRWLCELDGFLGFLVFSRDGESIGLTFWESREIADRYRSSRDEFRDRIFNVAGVAIEEVVDYELTFADLQALTVRTDATL
jgi:hypothetical protein